MLINQIQNDPVLFNFLCDDCKENGVGVNVSKDVKRSDFVILRVDEYYREHEKSNNRPKSPDCLIIQHFVANKFVLYLIELKALKSLKTECLDDIREKFQSCFDDFMSNRFRKYFYNTEYEFSIRLLFISNPKEGKIDKGKTTRMDNLLALPACRFANRKYLLQHKLPNPTIQPCQ